MAITNKVTWATDPKIDPVSGQPNKNPSIEARLRQFGWDFNEKPLRQDLNLVLNELGQNVEDLDQQYDDFITVNDSKPFMGFVPQGVLGVNDATPSVINFKVGVDAAVGVASLQEQSTQYYGEVFYRTVGGDIDLDGTAPFADLPVGNVYGINTGFGALPEDIYVITLLYRKSDDTINFIANDISQGYDIPAAAASLGYTFSAPLFPVVWTGTEFLRFYLTNDRVSYFQSVPVVMLSSITTALDTVYELDMSATAKQHLIPNIASSLNVVNRTQTVRAELTLLINGANVNDTIMSATGNDSHNPTIAFNLMSDTKRIGPVISPDTSVYMVSEFETMDSKLYYNSTQAGNTVTISGVVKSYINPFARHNAIK